MNLRCWISSLIDRYFIKKPRIRRAITRLLERDGEVDVQLLGTSLRIHGLQEHGYLRASRLASKASVFRDEAAVLINLASLLSGDDTFVDIGANIGLFSVTLARLKRLHPGLSFHAFEANPDTFARLAANTGGIGVHAENLAISDRNGTLEFVAGAVSHVFTSVEHANEYSILEERRTVPCRRLDSLDFPGGSLILKIDVEGQELEVLRGAAGLLAQGRVKAVSLDGYENDAVPALLAEHGFAFFNGRTLEPGHGKGYNILALRRPGA